MTSDSASTDSSVITEREKEKLLNSEKGQTATYCDNMQLIPIFVPIYYVNENGNNAKQSITQSSKSGNYDTSNSAGNSMFGSTATNLNPNVISFLNPNLDVYVNPNAYRRSNNFNCIFEILRIKSILEAWSEEEDRYLCSLVVQYGTQSWTKLCQHFTNRTAKQCRERWHNHVDPNVKKVSVKISFYHLH
jgi:hypothetical protein